MKGWRKVSDRARFYHSPYATQVLSARALNCDRGSLCFVPAFLHCELLLVLQENTESESVRDQQQRNKESRDEVSSLQLPRQEPRVIGLVESVQQIG